MGISAGNLIQTAYRRGARTAEVSMSMLFPNTALAAIALTILACGHARKVPEIVTDSSNHIQVKLRGGGFYGGINPTTEGTTTIHGDGEVTITHGSLYGGTTNETFFVAQNRVLELANFIVDNGFFEMDDIYDCAGDGECEESKHHYPPSVPLRLRVVTGNLEKEVVLTVYREDRQVPHPKALDTILSEVEELVTEAKGDSRP